MRANLVALILSASAAAAEPWVADISAPHVLGVSGIEVSADGTAFLAVSDAGWFLEGRLTRDDGALTGGEVTRVTPIMGQNGFPVRARRVGDWSDAEGLAMAEDGTLYVSFERWMRVARYPTTQSVAEWIKDHPDFRSYPANRQLEAVAINPEERIFALPESGGPGGGFPIYRLDPEGWSIAGRLEASDGYSVVGADFSPGGAFYVLERKLIFATWFQSRIRRVYPDTGQAESVWESARDAHGNLEGLSLWQGSDGLRATMVSDNNGRADVPTEIVEIRLTD